MIVVDWTSWTSTELPERLFFTVAVTLGVLMSDSSTLSVLGLSLPASQVAAASVETLMSTVLKAPASLDTYSVFRKNVSRGEDSFLRSQATSEFGVPLVPQTVCGRIGVGRCYGDENCRCRSSSSSCPSSHLVELRVRDVREYANGDSTAALLAVGEVGCLRDGRQNDEQRERHCHQGRYERNLRESHFYPPYGAVVLGLALSPRAGWSVIPLYLCVRRAGSSPMHSMAGMLLSNDSSRPCNRMHGAVLAKPLVMSLRQHATLFLPASRPPVNAEDGVHAQGCTDVRNGGPPCSCEGRNPRFSAPQPLSEGEAGLIPSPYKGRG